MDTFQGLFIESILVLTLFYLGYILFFSRETSFRQNRVYLLTGLILSLLLPFIQFPVPVEFQPEVMIRLKSIYVYATENQDIANESFLSVSNILFICYLAGVLLFSFRLIYQVWLISRFRKNATIEKKPYGKLVYTGKRHPVFSFFNTVYIGSGYENSEELDIILKHERVHIVQLHSFDLFLLELLVIVQWFNPLVWLYGKMIRQNHEYLADQGVINQGFSVDTYQYLLLSNFSAFRLGLANSFNHSLTFKRLIMMKKSNSNKLSALKLLLIGPAILLCLYFVSCSDGQEMENSLSNEAKELAPPPPPPPPPISDEEMKSEADDVYDASKLDEQPEFPGGQDELVKFVGKNTVYPVAAKEKGIQGAVYVRFVVNKDGKVENVKIIRNVDPLLDAEALRVVGLLPDWKPGKIKGEPVKVWFVLPIKFKLQ